MKAFIIHLSHIESSLATATAMIEPLRSSGFNVELFEGTYKDDVQEIFNNEGRTEHPIDEYGTLPNPNGKTTSLGVKACFYSHYRLWKKCVELNRPIFIFEDDVIFTRSYIPVKWEDVLLVCMGFEWDVGKKYIDYLTSPIGPPQAIDLLDPCAPGAVGYGIKPHAAKRLIELYHSTYVPADHALSNKNLKIQFHNYLMGRALVAADGKISLTKSKI